MFLIMNLITGKIFTTTHNNIEKVIKYLSHDYNLPNKIMREFDDKDHIILRITYTKIYNMKISTVYEISNIGE